METHRETIICTNFQTQVKIDKTDGEAEIDSSFVSRK